MLHDVLREGIKSSANSAFAVAMVLGYGYTVLKFIGYPFIVLVGIYFPTVGCGLRCVLPFLQGLWLLIVSFMAMMWRWYWLMLLTLPKQY
jgi:hypothetical protein